MRFLNLFIWGTIIRWNLAFTTSFNAFFWFFFNHFILTLFVVLLWWRKLQWFFSFEFRNYLLWRQGYTFLIFIVLIRSYWSDFRSGIHLERSSFGSKKYWLNRDWKKPLWVILILFVRVFGYIFLDIKVELFDCLCFRLMTFLEKIW